MKSGDVKVLLYCNTVLVELLNPYRQSRGLHEYHTLRELMRLLDADLVTPRIMEGSSRNCSEQIVLYGGQQINGELARSIRGSK